MLSVVCCPRRLNPTQFGCSAKKQPIFLMNVSDYFPTLLSLFTLSYITGFGVGLLLNAFNYFFKAFRI